MRSQSGAESDIRLIDSLSRLADVNAREARVDIVLFTVQLLLGANDDEN